MTATSKDRMVATTAHLLRAQGYAGTGLNQVTAEANAPKGSMYHHFPGGKEELAAEAIAHYAGTVQSLLEHCLQAPDIADGLDAFITALAHQLDRSQFRDGCPVGVVAMEAAAASERLAAATKAAFEQWRAVIARTMTEHGVPDPDDRATTVIAAVEGGVMLSRAHRSTGPLLSVSRSLRHIVNAGKRGHGCGSCGVQPSE